jgi:hypothetical protein
VPLAEALRAVLERRITRRARCRRRSGVAGVRGLDDAVLRTPAHLACEQDDDASTCHHDYQARNTARHSRFSIPGATVVTEAPSVSLTSHCDVGRGPSVRSLSTCTSIGRFNVGAAGVPCVDQLGESTEYPVPRLWTTKAISCLLGLAVSASMASCTGSEAKPESKPTTPAPAEPQSQPTTEKPRGAGGSSHAFRRSAPTR